MTKKKPLNRKIKVALKRKSKIFKRSITKNKEIISKKFNINFTFNSKFPIISLNLMRGFLSIKSDKKKTYINNFFDAYWCDGLNLNEELVIFSVLKKCKINKDDFRVKDSNGVGKYNVEETLWWSKETKCKVIEEKATWIKTKFKKIGKLTQHDNELVLDVYHDLKISDLFREKRYFHYREYKRSIKLH